MATKRLKELGKLLTATSIEVWCASWASSHLITKVWLSWMQHHDMKGRFCCGKNPKCSQSTWTKKRTTWGISSCSC
eukprot:12131188-Karenia_brevis.AAC.1